MTSCTKCATLGMETCHCPAPGDVFDPVKLVHFPGGVAHVPAPALARQEGGGHYKDLAIQPVQYIHANGIGFFEGNVIKYVTRWRAKGGVEDLKKARHYLDLLIELEGKA